MYFLLLLSKINKNTGAQTASCHRLAPLSSYSPLCLSAFILHCITLPGWGQHVQWPTWCDLSECQTPQEAVWFNKHVSCLSFVCVAHGEYSSAFSARAPSATCVVGGCVLAWSSNRLRMINAGVRPPPWPLCFEWLSSLFHKRRGSCLLAL